MKPETKEQPIMNRKQRRAFKLHTTHVPDAPSFDANTLERSVIQKVEQRKMEQTTAFVDAQRGKYPQTLTPEQKAGPHKEPYTAQLLAEIESGETSRRAIAKMKQTEDELMRLGVWKYSPYYTSFCEVLSRVKPLPREREKGSR
jgi:hypothetical protein